MTSHDVTVLSYSNAAKLSCDLCCFKTTRSKPLKARQKLRAHVYAKHQDVIPQLDKNTAKHPVINVPFSTDVPETSDVIEEVVHQISTQDHVRGVPY